MAPSALGTAYERVFDWNIELSSAALCALNRKMELLEDKFLTWVNRHVQSSVLQPSEKAKELVELPDRGTSYPHHHSSCNTAFLKSAFEISVLRESIWESNSYFCKKCKIKGSNGTTTILLWAVFKEWYAMISPRTCGSFFQSQVDTRDKSRDVYMGLLTWAPSCLLCQKLGCTIPVWICRLLQCMHWDQHWINYTRHLEFHITISKHPPGVLCDFLQ